MRTARAQSEDESEAGEEPQRELGTVTETLTSFLTKGSHAAAIFIGQIREFNANCAKSVLSGTSGVPSLGS